MLANCQTLEVIDNMKGRRKTPIAVNKAIDLLSVVHRNSYGSYYLRVMAC